MKMEEENKKEMGKQKRSDKYRMTKIKEVEVELLYQQSNRSLASIHKSVGFSTIRYIIMQSAECTYSVDAI